MISRRIRKRNKVTEARVITLTKDNYSSAAVDPQWLQPFTTGVLLAIDEFQLQTYTNLD